MTEKEKGKSQIIIIGKLLENYKKKPYKVSINFFYPKINVECDLKPNSKYVQSKIYCIIDIEINSEIFIENQIAYSPFNHDQLLLINEETFVKLEFKSNYLNKNGIKKYSSNPIKNEKNGILFKSINFFIIFLIELLLLKKKIKR